jgi:Acyl-protein synthetase, LuxE
VSFETEVATALRSSVATGAPLDFEAWALRVFRHQFERNPPYRSYCERRGTTPASVARWEDVPAVPTRAFRTTDLACGPAEATFRTSGTTGGAAARGRHVVPSLDLYRASALPTFEQFVLPDGARLACLFLLPPPALRPDSSLVHMCAWVGEAFGTSVEWLAGDGGLDVARLAERLRAVQSTGEAVLLAGPTAGFVRLFDLGTTVRLGPGSRLMDTGGQKGLDRPVSRAGFLRACWTHLGIPTYYCVNEYGMTELCSQRYDSVLRDRFAGRSLDRRRLAAPPWLRTRVLDPDTLAPVQTGETGLLCHHDLANAGSVSVVLTEDVGRALGDDGIEVTGRVPGAAPRGCGLLLAELERS